MDLDALINREESSWLSEVSSKRTMAGNPKKKPKWYEEQMARSREFRALLERRVQRDRELAAQREREQREDG